MEELGDFFVQTLVHLDILLVCKGIANSEGEHEMSDITRLSSFTTWDNARFLKIPELFLAVSELAQQCVLKEWKFC